MNYEDITNTQCGINQISNISKRSSLSDLNRYVGSPVEMGMGLEFYLETVNITDAKNRLLAKLYQAEGDIVQETLAVSLDHVSFIVIKNKWPYHIHGCG